MSRYEKIKNSLKECNNNSSKMQLLFDELLNTREEMTTDEFYELYDTLK